MGCFFVVYASKARFCWTLSNVLGKVDEDGYVTVPSGTYEISTSEYAPGYVTRGMYYKYDEDSYEIAESEMAWCGHLTINERCVTSRTMASYIMTAVKIMT